MIHQTPQKLLFICAQNKIRSVTAERMFAGSLLYQVRSRGIGNDARVKLTEGDLGWADVVFVMEKNHKNRIGKKFSEKIRGKKIICLFIEDIYEPMELSLIDELRRKLAPHVLLPEAKMPNQTPDPTTRSVTPPADAGDRAPASRGSS
jgi:predicted protein tyrosine phosphatase